MTASDTIRDVDDFRTEVVSRFGLLPNYFCSASSAPGLSEKLWGFARSAYLDSPLPSLLKERLFVHLSRFCEVRYCIVRHVGFLMGEGRPAGDPDAEPLDLERTLRLLRRPVPDAATLARSLRSMEASVEPCALPEPETEGEARLFDALTVIFLSPAGSAPAREAVRKLVGDCHFELLTAFLAFVRTAHYWTETHPEIGYEPDMVSCLQRHPELAALLLDTAEAAEASPAVRLRKALQEFGHAEEALRESKARSTILIEGIAQATWETDGAGVVVADSPSWRSFTGQRLEEWLGHGWLDAIHPEDRPDAERHWRAAVADKRPVDAELRLRHSASGGYRWTNIRAVPMVDDDGSILKWLGMNIDIDERKQAESRLHDREAALSRVQRIGGVGGIDIEVSDGMRSWRSPEYLRLHGLTPEPQEESHADWLRRVHPEDRVRAEAALVQALKGQADIYVSEYRIVRPSDGAVRWIHARADVERGPQGNPLRLVGAHLDVTEQKRMQEALRETEAKMRLNEVWLAAQKEAFQVAMNGGSLEESLGVLTGTMIRQAVDGRRCAFYVADDKRNNLSHVVGMPASYAAAVDGLAGSPESSAYGLAVATGKPVLTPDVLDDPRWQAWAWLARAHDYRGFWSFPVETSARRLVGCFAIYSTQPRDAGPDDLDLVAMITRTAAIVISRHHENEERIRSDERFRQFAAASSGALWIRDAGTLALEYASPAITSVYGVGPNELLGDVERWSALIVPDDRAAALGQIDAARRGEAIVHEFRIQRPSDQAFRWIRNIDFPLLDERGQVQRIGGIAEDITDAKLAVQHQGVLLAELQHRVRNIMAMVHSIAARTGQSATSVEEYALAVSGRVRTLARVQALLTRAANVGVPVATIVQEELAAQIQHSSQFTVAGPAVTLSPKAAEILSLALHELTTNALKHGALSSDAGRIDVGWDVAAQGGSSWLSFDWTERGDPGRRRAETSASPRRGFGSELIEGRVPYELGGRARLEIEPTGVRCLIEFPLQDGASILETDAPKRAIVLGGTPDMTGDGDLAGQRILVVEDDYLLATDTARMIQGAGGKVLGPCPTEDGALREIENSAPTAAMVDINLGAGPSFVVAGTLKRQGIPFVFTTGYDEVAVPPRFADVPRLQKPVDLKRIVDLVSKALAASPPGASEADDPLVHAASLAREQGRKARSLAQAETRSAVVEMLRDYADRLDNEAFAFEQQASELHRTVGNTQRLTTELRELVEVARKRSMELKARTRDLRGPARRFTGL